MSHRKSLPAVVCLLFAAVLLAGCSPAVGSAKWCATMKDKPKADWSANELADFAKHCLLS